MNEKFQQFEICMEILKTTETTIDKQIVINCLKQLKTKTQQKPTTEDFLYVCLCVLSCSTDDTVWLDSFKCIFENETICYTRLLKTLDHINSAIYNGLINE